MTHVEMPPLGATRQDALVALFKGALGEVPLVGSILAEIVGQLIPEQRMQRLERYAAALHQRLSKLEEAEVSARIRNPENLDLFEEGALQSVRALTDERIGYIANLVAHGISGEEGQRLRSKRLLNLLRELDDEQIIVLTGFLLKHANDEEFSKRHSAILEVIIPSLVSKQSEVDKSEIQQLAINQLIRLGLLRPRFEFIKRGTIPEFDSRTGMPRAARSPELTGLGRLVLRQFGLADDGDI